MKRDQEKDTVSALEEDEYLENSGESLLTLVQAELPTLSQNWFYALKDHALLSLPQGTYPMYTIGEFVARLIYYK